MPASSTPRWPRSIRRRFQDIIPLGRLESMLQARDKLDRGYLVGMLADRALADEATLA
jgi:predicted LPLAT superfamily acyltransferase